MPPDVEEIKAQLQEHGNMEDHMQQTKRTRHDTRLAEKHLASDIAEVREHAQDINRDSNEALQEVNPDHDSSPRLEAQDPNSRIRGRNTPAE